MSNDPELGGDKRKVSQISTGAEPGLAGGRLLAYLGGVLRERLEHPWQLDPLAEVATILGRTDRLELMEVVDEIGNSQLNSQYKVWVLSKLGECATLPEVKLAVLGQLAGLEPLRTVQEEGYLVGSDIPFAALSAVGLGVDRESYMTSVLRVISLGEIDNVDVAVAALPLLSRAALWQFTSFGEFRRGELVRRETVAKDLLAAAIADLVIHNSDERVYELARPAIGAMAEFYGHDRNRLPYGPDWEAVGMALLVGYPDRVSDFPDPVAMAVVMDGLGPYLRPPVSAVACQAAWTVFDVARERYGDIPEVRSVLERWR